MWGMCFCFIWIPWGEGLLEVIGTLYLLFVVIGNIIMLSFRWAAQREASCHNRPDTLRKAAVFASAITGLYFANFRLK